MSLFNNNLKKKKLCKPKKQSQSFVAPCTSSLPDDQQVESVLRANS